MNKEYHIGIDIGSTCAKLAVLDENQKLLFKSVQPTGSYTDLKMFLHHLVT